MTIAFSGPSTIGKDRTWLRVAQNLGFQKVVPYTSRKKRENEIVGDDYHFLSVEEFQEKIRNNRFIEWDYFAGNYYATDISVLELHKYNDLVFHELARKALRIKKRIPSLVAVMLLPSDEDVIKERLLKRGYKEEELIFRFHHFLEERTHAPLFDYIISNAEYLSDYEAEEIIKKIISENEK
jgi:guanylate kinase